jgi:hypothetical protein
MPLRSTVSSDTVIIYMGENRKRLKISLQSVSEGVIKELNNIPDMMSFSRRLSQVIEPLKSVHFDVFKAK